MEIRKELLHSYIQRLIIKASLFFIGCFFTYMLHKYLDASSVVASAAIGLAGTFLLLDKELQASIYCGSFAGMCSVDILDSVLEIIILSGVGAILLVALGRFFNGFGGKLGMIAFVSVSLVYLIRGLL